MKEFTFQGTLKLKPIWTHQLGATDVSDRIVINNAFGLNSVEPEPTYSNGLWKDGWILTTSAISIDLLALDQKVFGGTGLLEFSTIKMVYAENRGENDAEIFGSVAGRWPGASADSVIVPAGGIIYQTFPAGVAVSSGSSIVSLQSAAGTTDLAICFVGVVNE